MRKPAGKMFRVLYIYQMLCDKKVVKLGRLAAEFHASKRTLQRDIDDVKAFFADAGVIDGHYEEVVYDRKLEGYRLVA